MKKYWHKLSFNGTAALIHPFDLESVIITNRLCSIGVLFVLVIGTLLGIRQWNAEPIFVLTFPIVFSFILWLIHMGYSTSARLLLCFIIPMLVVGMSIISKLVPGEEITDSEYFDYRFVLIGTSIVPPLVFGFDRMKLLGLSILPFLLAFVLFDPLHNYFTVGYYQVEHIVPSYAISQWICTIMFGVIVSGALVLRKTHDEVQRNNLNLIAQLNDSNTQLEKAHDRFQKQNEELSHANHRLADKVALADQDLRKTNEELIRHNTELQQFSYIVSHDLRGPVASLLGLLELLKIEATGLENDIVEHIGKSARNLDNMVKDLGMIVDIRNDIHKIRQAVDVRRLIEDVLVPFQKEIQEFPIRIECLTEINEFYTVRPMLTSIVHNLISNAVKYSAKNRPPSIQIRTADVGGQFQFVIRDNGIGINLNANRANMFKLYKRFNTHTEGKGIGLYLVNLQVNALGGTIHVASEVDSFTEFTITLPMHENNEKQVLMDVPYSNIFFDATRTMIGIQWKCEVNRDEFRLVLNRSLNFMREYNATHGLMDIRQRGDISREDHLWLLENYFPSIFKLGLKRLAVIHTTEINQETLAFYERNRSVFEKYNIQIFFCESTDEAYQWLDEMKVLV